MTDYKQNIIDFVPANKSDLLAFAKYGVVPEGYLSQQDVAKICPACSEEMQKAHMPLIREERFISEINKRVALDIYKNAEAWAKAIAVEEDVLDTFRKADYAEVYDLNSIGEEALEISDDLHMRKAYVDVTEAYNELFPTKDYKKIRVPKEFESSAKHYRHTTARAKIAVCAGLDKDCAYSPELMKAVRTELMQVRYGTLVDKFKSKLRADKAARLECKVEPVIGTRPSLIDFVKAEPSASISGWAAKMKREGGSHPHSWCSKKAAKFASDPAAFCAAVHLAAYNKTPSQDKSEKKE